MRQQQVQQLTDLQASIERLKEHVTELTAAKEAAEAEVQRLNTHLNTFEKSLEESQQRVQELEAKLGSDSAGARSPPRARSPSPQRAAMQQSVADLEAQVAQLKALEADRQQLQQVLEPLTLLCHNATRCAANA